MLTKNRGTALLIFAIVIGFGIELATNSVGNDNALLRLGALPDDGQLRGEFWRIATYSFLHFSWLHLALNLGLLWWIGRIVEQQMGTARGALTYFVSVFLSAGIILPFTTGIQRKARPSGIRRSFWFARCSTRHFLSAEYQ